MILKMVSISVRNFVELLEVPIYFQAGSFY